MSHPKQQTIPFLLSNVTPEIVCARSKCHIGIFIWFTWLTKEQGSFHAHSKWPYCSLFVYCRTIFELIKATDGIWGICKKQCQLSLVKIKTKSTKWWMRYACFNHFQCTIWSKQTRDLIAHFQPLPIISTTCSSLLFNWTEVSTPLQMLRLTKITAHISKESPDTHDWHASGTRCIEWK